MNLRAWEIRFRNHIEKISLAERKKAGSLLPIIPTEEEWLDFAGTVKSEWLGWNKNLQSYPCCLLVLYCGAAFFEYEERRFWPKLGNLLGDATTSSPNTQKEINLAFAKVIKEFGLTIIERRNGINSVGTAIYCVGIPLSLWDDFLDLCEWAMWQKGWQELQKDQWSEAVSRIGGGRRYLTNFLLENREVATTFIKEMLDTRRVLSEDANLTISDLAEATLLRQEYFDAVPETAEFLRPSSPDTVLSSQKPYLVWHERNSLISLYLPAISEERLPAEWEVAGSSLCCAASSTPHELSVDSKAFEDHIFLTLKTNSNLLKFKIRGFRPWVLFDLDKNTPINTNRQKIPTGPYALLSPEPLLNVERVRFQEEDNPINEVFSLRDGTKFYVTKLWPTARTAEVTFRCGDESKKLAFRSRLKVSPFLYIGRDKKAAFFERLQDRIKLEHWPILGISIPKDYFSESLEAVNKHFRILVDERPAGGCWKRSTENESSEIFTWEWSRNPCGEPVAGKRVVSLAQIGELYSRPDMKGERCVVIHSPEYGIRREYQIYLDHSRREMEGCWDQLPGSYLPMLLIVQSPATDGMKWEDLLLARDVLARRQSLSYYLLRKYEKNGVLYKRGRYWAIGESRAAFRQPSKSDGTDEVILKYCGDPSILWTLYRYMSHQIKHSQPPRRLPVITVIDNRGEIPYLAMGWSADLFRPVLRYLRTKGVRVTESESLWNT